MNMLEHIRFLLLFINMLIAYVSGVARWVGL